MSFRDMRLPQRICDQFKGGPTFATSMARSRAGYVQANVDRPDVIFKYEANLFLKDDDLRLQLLAFYLNLFGMGYTFRFRDMGHYWTGCQAYGGMGDIVPLAPASVTAFATGDGAEEAYQLQVPYAIAGYTFMRQITKPAKWGVDDTEGDNPGYLGPRVWVNNVLKTEGADYDIDYSTGVVTFAVAPTNGHSIKWAGLFDVMVRWEDDTMLQQLLESPGMANVQLRVIEEL